MEHCKEFPLALEVVGKSLREQPPEIWLKKLHSTLNSEDDCSEDVLCDCLQSCLDDLKSATLKECFVDLGLFPEDQRIPAAALIDIWLELYGKENDCLAIGELLRLTSHGLANLVVTRYKGSWIYFLCFIRELYYRKNYSTRNVLLNLNHLVIGFVV